MKNVYRFSLLAAVAVFTAACQPTMDTRGTLLKPGQLAKIVPGKSTEDDVTELLGTPATTMTYGEDVWHYISSRVKTESFFKPQEVERTVVSIYFDKEGKVREVKTIGLDQGEDITMVSRETPSAGKDMSVIEQLLGNVGKFNKTDSKGQ
ncbi:MAG: outer membrane protein assembly factor BamE [Magnetospirillum sp.]|nr:outer membrane protein assembly factor BamE [Magnetospirillum sp.]